MAVRFRHARLKGTAGVQCNASEMLAAYMGEMPHKTRWAEALPTRATRKYKCVGCPFVANHGTQEAHHARGMHGGHNWRTYMAGDASVQSTIRPKHPKSTVSESATEREKRGTLTCPCYLLGAITYEQNKTISGRRSILLCSSCLFI